MPRVSVLYSLYLENRVGVRAERHGPEERVPVVASCFAVMMYQRHRDPRSARLRQRLMGPSCTAPLSLLASAASCAQKVKLSTNSSTAPMRCASSTAADISSRQLGFGHARSRVRMRMLSESGASPAR